MAKSGMNGYFCEMVEDPDNTNQYVLTVQHSVHDGISARETVASSDLNHDYPIDSREQHEALFAPIIKRLESDRRAAEAKKQHDDLDTRLEEERKIEEAQAQHQEDIQPTEAEDGTTSAPSGQAENTTAAAPAEDDNGDLVETDPENPDLDADGFPLGDPNR